MTLERGKWARGFVFSVDVFNRLEFEAWGGVSDHVSKRLRVRFPTGRSIKFNFFQQISLNLNFKFNRMFQNNYFQGFISIFFLTKDMQTFSYRIETF